MQKHAEYIKALTENDVDTVLRHLEANPELAHIELESEKHSRSIHYAATHTDGKLVKLFLERAVDPNTVAIRYGGNGGGELVPKTALRIAAEHQYANPSSIALIQHGARFSHKGFDAEHEIEGIKALMCGEAYRWEWDRYIGPDMHAKDIIWHKENPGYDKPLERPIQHKDIFAMVHAEMAKDPANAAFLKTIPKEKTRDGKINPDFISYSIVMCHALSLAVHITGELSSSRDHKKVIACAILLLKSSYERNWNQAADRVKNFESWRSW